MGWTTLQTALRNGQEQIDRQLEKLWKQAEAEALRLYCEKGCCNCCSLTVNCSFVEARSIAEGLTSQQRRAVENKIGLLRQFSLQAEGLKDFLRLYRKNFAGCPFLEPEAGSCSIYPRRPFSCRALLSTRNSSWCAVDYADLHPLEKEAFLSSLDPDVVAFPTHYLAASQELGLEHETQVMAAMRDQFGLAMSGTLVYQVWLEMEYQLSAHLPQGADHLQCFLEEKNLLLPFLLQLQ